MRRARRSVPVVRVALPVTALALGVLGGCGSGDEGVGTAGTSSSGAASAVPSDARSQAPVGTASRPAAPAAAPAATPPAAPTATPTPAADAAGRPPRAPVQRPALDGDVDGDGEVDDVALADGTLTVRLSGGGSASSAVTLDDAPGEIAGVVDGDGDGRGEVWATTASGASTTFVTPFRLVDGALREVTLDGQAVRLGYGGTVTHGNGFACDRDEATVTVTEVESRDGATYQGTATTYRWVGATLEPVSAVRVTGGPEDDDVAAGSVVACGSLGE